MACLRKDRLSAEVTLGAFLSRSCLVPQWSTIFLKYLLTTLACLPLLLRRLGQYGQLMAQDLISRLYRKHWDLLQAYGTFLTRS